MFYRTQNGYAAYLFRLLFWQRQQEKLIGADFLHKLNLLVDVCNNKLLDNITHLTVSGVLSHSFFYILLKCIISITNLQEFSLVTSPQEFMVTVKHTTVHQIETQRSLIHERPRRLI